MSEIKIVSFEVSEVKQSELSKYVKYGQDVEVATMQIQPINVSANELTDQIADIHYCKECKIVFNARKELFDHNAVKHKLRKFQCYFCDMSFQQHHHFRRHVSTLHSAEKYACSMCDAKFPRSDSLNKHTKEKHLWDMPLFQCRDCTLQFPTVQDLAEHERLDHVASARHRCTHCGTRFKRRDHMMRHVRAMHLMVVHDCPLCTMNFKRRDQLTRHLNNKHCYVVDPTMTAPTDIP